VTLAAVVLTALVGCAAAGEDFVADAPSGLQKAADPCAMEPAQQRVLMRDHVLPILPPEVRTRAYFLDDCSTAVDAAYAWVTGGDMEASLAPFLTAGWQPTAADAPEGWTSAVLGGAGGHRFRIDVNCDKDPDPAPDLPEDYPDPPGCFAQARLVS
jgi:hypothetical protein